MIVLRIDRDSTSLNPEEFVYKIHALVPDGEKPLSSSEFMDVIRYKEIGCPCIKEVLFNPPATIVFWSDGTKTVAKCQDEPWDAEKGLLMAITKKYVPKKKLYSLLDSAVQYDDKNSEEDVYFSDYDFIKVKRKVKCHDTK